MTPRAEALLKMLDQMPGDHRCLYGIGMEFMSEDACGAAVHWLERAAASDPNDVYTWYHLARALIGSGREDDSLRALERGAEAARRSADAKGASEIEALRESMEP